MKTVYLVRHGESTENTRGDEVFVGGEAGLTERGRDQAEAIAKRAAKLPIQTIVASTMVRAQETAGAISAACGLKIVSSDLFVEAKTPHSFLGRRWDDESFLAAHAKWQNTTVHESDRFEDGENFGDMLERAQQALRFLEGREEEELLVVTHGFFLRFLVGVVMLEDELGAADMRMLQRTYLTRNTGVTVIMRGEDGAPWQLLTWNDHAHLG